MAHDNLATTVASLRPAYIAPTQTGAKNHASTTTLPDPAPRRKSGVSGQPRPLHDRRGVAARRRQRQPVSDMLGRNRWIFAFCCHFELSRTCGMSVAATSATRRSGSVGPGSVRCLRRCGPHRIHYALAPCRQCSPQRFTTGGRDGLYRKRRTGTLHVRIISVVVEPITRLRIRLCP